MAKMSKFKQDFIAKWRTPFIFSDFIMITLSKNNVSNPRSNSNYMILVIFQFPNKEISNT